ncbi:hypothetical protein ZWY2020_057969 [Hordeum vulgare]|nr:hypothetical protein ZWY2020_057969 [Hordeum vulgare]
MTPAGYSSWSDLTSELLVSIAATDGMSLRDYASLRGVCTAWRSALAPLSYPCLLSVERRHYIHVVSVFSPPLRRSFHLHTGPSFVVGPKLSYRGHAQVVGSASGRLAIGIDRTAFSHYSTRRIFLVDSRAGKKVQLVSPAGDNEIVSKIVFAPNPNLMPSGHNNGCTAVALYGRRSRVAYIDTGGSSTTEEKDWTTVDVPDGSTSYDDIMAYIDTVGSSTTDENEWTTVDVPDGRHYDDMAYHAGDDKVYLLSSRGSVDVLGMPRGDQPAVIEPLASLVPVPNPISAYAPPYDAVSTIITSKHIFFCHGSLYQVWRNICVDVKLTRLRPCLEISADQIFVLRYDPGRWPRWDAVKDLGGCSVFLSQTGSPAVVRPGVPEVTPDCVYWIDRQDVPMVCDIATGVSKPWMVPNGTCEEVECWYVDHDDATIIDCEGTN